VDEAEDAGESILHLCDAMVGTTIRSDKLAGDLYEAGNVLYLQVIEVIEHAQVHSAVR
jgi:hypothetical protein